MKTFHIELPDLQIREALIDKINNLTKPKGSLGVLEELALQIGLIQQTLSPTLRHPHNILFAADHGIVEEGVSKSPKEITWQQLSNFLHGGAGVNFLCRQHGFKLVLVDAGVDYDLPYEKGIINCSVGRGTRSFLHAPAMSHEEMELCLERGAQMVDKAYADGCNVISFGEMGIGNTTPSSALVSVLLNLPANEVTGRGAGLSDEAYNKKVAVIEQAVDRYWKATENSEIPEGPFFKIDAAVELMSHLGGYEIAAMAGMCLGGAVFGVPIVLDGYISVAGALCASLINSDCTRYLLASHISAEPAAWKVLRNLHLEPVIQAGMCLGEGTGAAAAMSLYDMGLAVYRQMGTFEDIHVTQYENYAKKQAEK